MKLSIQNLFPLVLAATLSYGAYAAEEGDIFVNLKCAATAQPKQPCGGTNSRKIALMISVHKTSHANGYREAVSYGGCYPISDDNFGSIENVRRDGDEILFDLQRTGSIWGGGIPVIHQNSDPGKAVSARLNVKTSVLKLDTSTVFWPYAKPDELQCQPNH